MWKVPSKFCDCKRTGDTKKGGFVLGQRFGWWVHSGCGKPTNTWMVKIGSALFHAMGKNLLTSAPPEYKYEPRPSREMLQHVGVQLRIGDELTTYKR